MGPNLLHYRGWTGQFRGPGWAVLAIPEDEEGPPFAYSIGMYRTLGHADVILIGQKIEAMHAIINHIGEQVRGGQRFEDGGVYPDILEGFDVCFRQVPPARYPEYLGYGRWFYKGDDFPVLQCVWPDRQGRFPWDPGAPEGFRARQPVLSPRQGSAPTVVSTATIRPVASRRKPVIAVRSRRRAPARTAASANAFVVRIGLAWPSSGV